MTNWKKALRSEFQIHFKNSPDEFQFLETFISDLLAEQEEKIIRLMIRHYGEFMEEVWRPYRGSKTCGEVAIEWFKKIENGK